MPACLFAEIGIPGAKQCLQVLAPVAGFLLLRWVLRQTDSVIRKFLPGLEFHHQLGWLNIRSERRANAVLRVLSGLVYATLALALYGIVWSASGLGQLPSDAPPTDALSYFPVLLLSSGSWLAYLGWELIPKLQREYESEELERYRAELALLEQASGEEPGSREAYGSPSSPLKSDRKARSR